MQNLKILRFKLKCKKLYNKICRWFKEKRKPGDFEFRFTGEETKKFCHGFMFIIEDLICDGSDIEQPQNFFALSMARMGLHLRNTLSLAVRVSDIKMEDCVKLEGECRVVGECIRLYINPPMLVSGQWGIVYHFTQNS